VQLRTTTPDFVVDGGPLHKLGIRWVDLKHSFGRGEAGRYRAQVERYVQDWGPGCLVFTLGYTEALAEDVRQAGPVWVLDPATGERILANAGRGLGPSTSPRAQDKIDQNL